MLPNEIIDKIFKYRYQDFRIFLSKIKKVNREYREKFELLEDNCFSHILSNKIPDANGYHFKYNYRNIETGLAWYRDIYYPGSRLKFVALLSKNYR